MLPNKQHKLIIIFCIILNSIASYSQEILSVNPNTGNRNEKLTVSISGSNTYFRQATATSIWFQQGTSTFIYPDSINAYSETEMEAVFKIKYNAPKGKYDVKLFTEPNTISTLANGFTVLDALPISFTINPDTARQKETLTVSLSGENTHFLQATSTQSLWFQQGTSTFIYPTSINATSDTKMDAVFTIKHNDPTGKYDVKLFSKPNVISTLTNGFTVLDGLPSGFTIKPDSAKQKQTLMVSLSGENTHFLQATSTESLWFQQGTSTIIYPNFIESTDDNTLQAEFSFTYDTPTGIYDVKTYNDADGDLMIQDGFKIIAAKKGKISNISNSQGQHGQSLNISISTENTNFKMAQNTTVWLEQGSNKIYADPSLYVSNDSLISCYFYFGYEYPSGYYDLHLYNAIDGPLTILKTFYLEASAPNIIQNPYDTEVCEGGNSWFFVYASSFNYTFQWQVSEGWSDIWTDINGAISPYFSLNNTSISMNENRYRCVLTGDENLSTTSEAAILKVNPKPDASVTTKGSTLLCQGDIAELATNNEAGLTYQWYENGSYIYGAIDSLYFTDKTGFYQVELTNSNGCSSFSQAIELKQKIKLDLGNDIFTYGNKTVTLDAGPGFASYLWSTGETTQAITFDSTGFYSNFKMIYVTVTDNDNCKATDSIGVGFDYYVSVKKTDKEENLIISPNPTNGLINVYLYDILGDIEMNIINIQGQTILKEKFENTDKKCIHSIDLSGISKGVYFISIDISIKTQVSRYSKFRKIIVN